MRDPARIDRILDLLGEQWKREPDLRLTQMVVNLVRPVEPCPGVFYFEDNKLEKILQNLVVPHIVAV